MPSPRNLSNIRQHGFTAIELMVVIAVLAVLLSLAVPAFQSFIISNRLTGQANDLVASLSLARSEAAARSRNVQVCIAASSTSCAVSGDWAAGYIVSLSDVTVVDPDPDGDPLTNDATTSEAITAIKYFPPLEGGVSLAASNAGRITFRPSGGLSGSTAWTFTLCSPGETKGREVTVPATGRATAKRIETCT